MERRAYVRQPLQLPARAAGEDGAGGACRIQDFCDGGLFLGIEGGAGGALDPARFAPRDRVQVRFTVEVDGTVRDFTLTGRVARSLSSGLGLAFEAPEPATLQVLQALAAAGREPAAALAAGGAGARAVAVASVARAATAAPTRPAAPGRPAPAAGRPPALALLHERAAHLLEEVLPEFFKQAEEALLASANEAKSGAEQARRFDAMMAFRREAGATRQATVAALLGGIDALAEGRMTPRAEGAGKGTELKLVEKTDFEQFLVASEISRRLELVHKQALAALSQRLVAALPRDSEPLANPLAPAAFCHALSEGCARLETGIDERALIYRAFEQVLAPRLADFYASVNAALKEAGILPGLAVEPTPIGARAQAPAARPPVGAQAPSAEVPSTPEAAEEQAGPVVTDTTDTTATVAEPAPPPQLSEAFATARSLLGGQKPAPGRSAQAQRGQMLVPVDRAALVQALSVFQRQVAQGAVGGAEAVREAVDEQLSATHGSSAQGVELLDSDVMDVVADLMGAMVEDPGMSATGREAVERLGVPLHRLALIDDSFLTSEDHPARQVVNQLARLQGAPDEAAEAQLRERVGGLVGRILERYDGDSGVFGEVLGELTDLVERQEQGYAAAVERVVRTCEQQQATLLARRKARGPDAGPAHAPRALPAEWEQWLARARRLAVGDRVVFHPGTPRASQATLAWVGADFNPFVFVDNRGAKSASLGLQEVAMQLRRGTLSMVEDADQPAVDRAMLKMLQRVQSRLEPEAARDQLTRLPGRRALESALEGVLAGGDPAMHSVACVSAAGLASINGEFGREAGDALLKACAERIAAFWQDARLSARTGGASFGVLLSAPVGELTGRMRQFAKALQDTSVEWKGRPLRTGWGVGLKGLSADLSAAQVLAAAEEAAARARSAPGGGVELADASPAQGSALPNLEQRLEQARLLIEQGHLRLRIQRLAPTRAGETLRLIELRLGAMEDAVGPELLTLAAERNGYVLQQTLAGLRVSFAWLARNAARGCVPELYLLPLSGRALADQRVLEAITQYLLASPLPPGRICFLLSDPSALDPLSDARIFARAVTELGCRLALEGFGSGAFAYEKLGQVPAELVVITPSYITDLSGSAGSLSVTRAINEVAHFMGKRTIARGIDSGELLARVGGLGIDFAVGAATEPPTWLGEVKVDVSAPGKNR